MQCSNCNFTLPGQECPSCGKENVLEAKFCNWCGNELASAPAAVENEEGDQAVKSGERLACSDGMCIGIIGDDGLCVVCAKAYSGPPSLEEDAGEDAETEETDQNPKEPEAK